MRDRWFADYESDLRFIGRPPFGSGRFRAIFADRRNERANVESGSRGGYVRSYGLDGATVPASRLIDVAWYSVSGIAWHGLCGAERSPRASSRRRSHAICTIPRLLRRERQFVDLLCS